MVFFAINPGLQLIRKMGQWITAYNTYEIRVVVSAFLGVLAVAALVHVSLLVYRIFKESTKGV